MADSAYTAGLFGSPADAALPALISDNSHSRNYDGAALPGPISTPQPLLPLAELELAHDFAVEASMAKLFATEAASRIADQALQIHGGYGYSRGLPLERYLRDLRVFRIYEGTSEIQRNIIARNLLKR